jgi:hypothetical protein
MKDFKKMPKMACGGGVKKMQAGGNVSDMYVPERPVSGMYVPERPVSGMYVPEKTPVKKIVKPTAEEFNLYQTVKKAANKDGLKAGGKVKRGKVTKK